MSNKYLFNEEPKSFSPTIAEALDSISKAVIIQQIHCYQSKILHQVNGGQCQLDWANIVLKG